MRHRKTVYKEKKKRQRHRKTVALLLFWVMQKKVEKSCHETVTAQNQRHSNCSQINVTYFSLCHYYFHTMIIIYKITKKWTTTSSPSHCLEKL